ncbi:MAG: DUF664 domain-containing protein [Anaerolineales bacterium]|nr:DUF664 domain-containing protein [Anaerolineales bacterium]
MPYIVCAEENDRRWIAHVPDLPGCYSSHTDREKAIYAIPDTIQHFMIWCESHGIHISGLAGPMLVAEVIRAWEFEDGYEVNAFFASDRPPLVKAELEEYRLLLIATRNDLKSVVSGLSENELHWEFPEERWPIQGVLMHVARAEHWYLDRLGLGFPKSEFPEDPFEALEKVRNHTLESLPSLSKFTGVVTLAGETWTARKVMRRTLWHERDHTEHIQKLRTLLPEW